MPKRTKTKPVKAAKSATKRTKRPIVFVNNKGNVMHLKGSLTLTDLVKMGVTKFRLMPVGTPLMDGEWRSTEVADVTP